MSLSAEESQQRKQQEPVPMETETPSPTTSALKETNNESCSGGAPDAEDKEETPMEPPAVNTDTSSDTDDDDDDNLALPDLQSRDSNDSNDTDTDTPKAPPTVETVTDPTEAVLQAVTHKTEGNSHFQNGELNHAARSYRKGTSLLKPLNQSNTGDAQVKALLLTLQTNLSMVCYKQDKHDQAVKVATCALQVDDQNVKALYRRAVACRKLGNLEGAKRDLKLALKCNGGNIKIIQKEWVAVKKELEQLKRKEKAALSRAFSSKGGSFLYEDKEEEEKLKEIEKKAKVEAEKVVREKRKQDWEDECVKRLADGNDAISFDEYEKELKAKKEEEEKARKKARKEEEEKRAAEKRVAREALRSSDRDSEDDNDDDDDELTESEMKLFRGYKKTSDGRTTSYFSREQTEEEKKLLGNIAPQKLSTIPQPLDNVTSTTNANTKAASAWNQAGTWEEKNTSDWCTSSLEAHLEETRVEMNSLVAIISEVKDLTGEASVVMVSGKKRYVFDYNTTLKYKIVDEEDDTVGSGTFQLPEISSTSIDEELEVLGTGWKMHDTEDTSSESAIETRDALVNQVRSQVVAFVAAFNTQF